MKKNASHAALVNYIVARVAIGEYQPGDRIPSVRRLARKFRLSYSGAYRGILALRQTGLLTAAGGACRVCRRAGEPAAGGRRIAVFWDNGRSLPGGIHDTIFGELRELAERGNYTLRAIPVARGQLTPALIREQARDAAGGIFIGEYDEELADAPPPFPVVATLLGETFAGAVSTVGPDPFRAASDAVAFFLRKRLRRVAVIADPEPVYRWRGELFQTLWTAAGGDCGADPADGEGLFFTSDRRAARFLEESRERTGEEGWPGVPFSVDGEQLLAPELPRCRTSAADWGLIGRTLFWEIHHRIVNPAYPVRHIRLEGRETAEDAR